MQSQMWILLILLSSQFQCILEMLFKAIRYLYLDFFGNTDMIIFIKPGIESLS